MKTIFWNTRVVPTLGLLSLLIAVLAFGSQHCSAATFVNRRGAEGTVQDVVLGSASWTLSGSPYIVESRLTVAARETLTIHRGVIVKVDPGTGIYIKGDLIATDVTFTNNQPSEIGSTTRARSGTPSWLGIYLSPASGKSALRNCRIVNAGAACIGFLHNDYRSAAIYVDDCSPRIVECQIENSAGSGIELWSSAATIFRNRFLNLPQDGSAIILDNLDQFPNVSGNEATPAVDAEGGDHGVRVPGGMITGRQKWTNGGANFPWLLDGDIVVAVGARLTVMPGTVVKSVNGKISVFGRLDTMGTREDPILFTSRAPRPAPGDWYGLYFGPTAGDSYLAHTVVEYAGKLNSRDKHTIERSAAIYTEGCNPMFINLSARGYATSAFAKGLTYKASDD